MAKITVVKGTSKTLRLTVSDEDGTAVDLTGATIYFCVKANITDTALVIQKVSTTASEITILTQSGATLGQADIFILFGDTSSLDVGQYTYDVWVVTAAGLRYQVVGPDVFEIVRSVTVLP